MLLEYIILESYPCDKYLYDTFFCSISFVIIWAWCFWFFERSMSWRATCYDIIMREEIPLNSNAINMYSILWRMCSSWLQRAFKYVAKAVFWGIKWLISIWVMILYFFWRGQPWLFGGPSNLIYIFLCTISFLTIICWFHSWCQRKGYWEIVSLVIISIFYKKDWEYSRVCHLEKI